MTIKQKTMKRIHIFAIAAVLTLNLTVSLSAQAQLDPDPGGTGGALWGTTSDPEPTEDLAGSTPPPAPGNDVPVDGGLSLLLAAGAAYGAKRLRKPGVSKE
jgi:hypothetical protein